jgi:translation initiation factor IF-2
MNKIIYAKPPIIVKELAQHLGLSPFQLIHDLANMSVFVRIRRSIKPEVASAICEKYDCRLEINDPRPPLSL